MFLSVRLGRSRGKRLLGVANIASVRHEPGNPVTITTSDGEVHSIPDVSMEEIENALNQMKARVIEVGRHLVNERPVLIGQGTPDEVADPTSANNRAASADPAI